MLLLNILSQQVTPDICQKLKQDQARGRRMPASPEVMAMFFAGGISESLRSWFTGGKKRSEEDIKKQLSDIMRAVYPRWTRADTLSSGKKSALDIVIVVLFLAGKSAGVFRERKSCPGRLTKQAG